MRFYIVIPARYASTRLPGKPLVDIAGMTMLQHVYERALESGAQAVTIATDDVRIERVAKSFGAPVCMTRFDHQSGTERLAEAVEQLGYSDSDIVVNLQCDEPMIPPVVIRQTAQNLALHAEADIATLCKQIFTAEELLDPNIVKVVRDVQGYALYFSRAPIAWDRNGFKQSFQEFSSYAQYYRHIGLYAYRVAAIKKYISWSPCYLEQMECLEQLRVLWHGGRIHVAVAAEAIPIGVDTPEDLIHLRNILQISKKKLTN